MWQSIVCGNGVTVHCRAGEISEETRDALVVLGWAAMPPDFNGPEYMLPEEER